MEPRRYIIAMLPVSARLSRIARFEFTLEQPCIDLEAALAA
jgi:hypothetical protein